MTGEYKKQKSQSGFLGFISTLRTKTTLVTIFVTVLLVVSGVFYMLQMNTLSTQGYKIDSLKEEINDLQERNQQLELTVAELQSIKKIAERIESLGMVKVAVIDYLSPTGTSVAVR